ncbi:MAG: rRNA maturation RNase YbeY [Rhodospirillales bacterium]|nr:rRNA maturation RNase YbeY [Rhodospirillales bacterium]
MTERPEIFVIIKCEEWHTALPGAESLAKIAAATALAGQPPSVEVSVVLADDEFLTALNLEYRGLDEPTNVLSFPGDLPAGDEENSERPSLLGDVVVALGVWMREAGEVWRGVTPEDHFSHLVVHGILHLLGYDHVTDEDATVMEELEIKLLRELGAGNPYGDHGTYKTSELKGPGAGQPMT